MSIHTDSPHRVSSVSRRAVRGNRPSQIEQLESRIAPASIVTISPNAKVATWIDVDGDLVTLKASKAILADTEFTFLVSQPGDIGSQLALLDLHTVAAAAGVNLTFTATPDKVGHHGNGSVNVGRIDATGIDLGAVRIPGDLASITAGDTDLTTAAIARITVNSGGALGLATQGAQLGGVNTTNEWAFAGKTGAITIKGNFSGSIDVNNADGTVNFDANASIASVTIGGSLIGSDDTLRGSDGIGAGYVFSEGPMGPVSVGGDIIGGTVKFGGSITSAGSIKSVIVGGNIRGGSATGTGLIFASGTLGPVTVGGSLVGGNSVIGTTGAIATVIDSAGAIGTSSGLDAVKIRGDVFPGVGTFCGAIYTTPDTHASIKSVQIAGTLFGYDSIITDGISATLHVQNGIYSDAKIGPVKVGAITGTNPGAVAQIVARGVANPANANAAVAITSVTVTGGVYSAHILAGFNASGVADNPDVRIGTVSVGQDFVGSSISAGVTAATNGFGDTGSVLATAGTGFSDNPAITSAIANIKIGGPVSGNPFAVASFTTGIVAQQIVAMKIGLATIGLTPNTGALDVFPLGLTAGFFVREVA